LHTGSSITETVETAKKSKQTEQETKPVTSLRTLGIVAIASIVFGFVILNNLPRIFGGHPATEAPIGVPAATEPPATEPPATEAPTELPATEAPAATEAPLLGTPTPPLPFSDTTIEFVFGPQDGSLEHDADDASIATYAPSVDLRDFIVVATFRNPYSVSNGTWDYGFLFRVQDGINHHYRLIISWNQQWELAEVGTVYSTIQGGELSNLDITQDGSNTVWLYCQGDKGLFYLNEEFIADLDLSAHQNSGDVWIGTGFINGAEINGHSTDYKEFAVWKIP
jgi:hypothetical protein